MRGVPPKSSSASATWRKEKRRDTCRCRSTRSSKNRSPRCVTNFNRGRSPSRSISLRPSSHRGRPHSTSASDRQPPRQCGAGHGGLTGRRILIRTRLSSPGAVRCSIEDDGPGIEPAHLPHIFGHFFTTKEGGMGIGLQISRSIVEAHGGRIAADNNSAMGGARFTITLPGRRRLILAPKAPGSPLECLRPAGTPRPGKLRLPDYGKSELCCLNRASLRAKANRRSDDRPGSSRPQHHRAKGMAQWRVASSGKAVIDQIRAPRTAQRNEAMQRRAEALPRACSRRARQSPKALQPTCSPALATSSTSG